MSDFLSNYFGPLNKDACVYFLIISVIFFITLVLVLGSEIIYVFQHLKQLNLRIFTIQNNYLALFQNTSSKAYQLFL